jgi:D-sedoheptulose 7-phosphate isomerase
MSINFKEYLIQVTSESVKTKNKLLESEDVIQMIQNFSDISLKTLKGGGKIIFAGNGGSFADAQHLSAEFTSRFLFDRSPLASVALGTNSSSMSAIGNDYGYENVFSRELEAIGKTEDLFVPITTSGNSKNIIDAVKVANEKGIKTICLTGSNQASINDLCDCICVPSTDTARIQECHILIGHIVCGFVENKFFKNS